MTLIVSTARITYAGPDRLDVTAKGRDPLGRHFAPSWGLVRPYVARRRAGLLGPGEWRAYVEAYTVEMRRSYAEHRAAWRELLGRERVTLCCYCTSRRECHRYVLAGILGKLGAWCAGEVGA